MYCPSCGRENVENQNFCTGCGLKLFVAAPPIDMEKQAQALAQAPVYLPQESKIWQNPVIYGLFIIAVGMFMMMFGKRALGDKTITDIGTVIALIGAGLIGLKGIFLVLQQAGVMQLPKHQVPQQLPPGHHISIYAVEPNSSVVEHTTRNLDAVPVYEKPRNTRPT